MKKLLISLAIFGFATLMFVACEKDEEGDFRERYVGTWNANDSEGWNAPAFYKITIRLGNSGDEVIIKGLYNHPDEEITAVVDEYSLDIPAQTAGNIFFLGSARANYDFDQVTFTYTANDGTGNDEVKTICTR